MILKNYTNFINERLQNSEIREYEAEITGVNKLISNKLGLNDASKLSTYVEGNYNNNRQTTKHSNKPFFQNDHNVFIEIYTLKTDEISLDVIEKIVYNILPFAEVYDINDPARNKSKIYVFSYNLEEFLNSDIAKSIKGINKYQL